MYGNKLTFSRSGNRSRLYCVDPLLFPQYTVLNDYFLPADHELPAHGLRTRFLPFDFGFNDPTLVIAPYDTVPFPVPIGENFLAEAITGVSDVLGPATVPGERDGPAGGGALANVLLSPSYLINFQHTHAGNTRQWASKSVTNLEAVGTGENPLLFKSPVLIPKGDTLTCTVTNLLNAQQRVQVMLLGGAFD